MTNLKICEEIDANHGGSVGFTLWEPIDPQPCCTNCKKNCYSMPCGIAPGHRSRLGDDNFYCSVWELRE